jgi:predicted ribosome quality control (RQC) complex YloA/Tae2 family protein
MDEQLKDRVLIAMAILVTICLILAISSSVSAQKNKKNLQKEMVSRLDAEEKFANLSPRLSELENIKANLEGTQKALEEQKIVNQELSEELVKMKKLKEAIEEDLKEALVRCKK